MKQADLGLNLSTKRTRKREFLDEMNRAVPWAELVALVAPFAPEGKKGRPPFAVATMLRVHFMQQWFGLSDPAMEEAPHDVPLYREFSGLDNWMTRLPDESTILRFRHLLEKHNLAAQILVVINDMLRDKGLMLRAGTVVDATLIAAPSSARLSSRLAMLRSVPAANNSRALSRCFRAFASDTAGYTPSASVLRLSANL